MTSPNDLPSVGTEDAPSMANYTFTIVADSGYESTTEGRCSAKQYGAVIYALHNDDSYADQRDKLASERDALAGRVAELEAKRDAAAEVACGAVRKAFSLGQTYWQQADSEYTSQHRKAEGTWATFKALIEETRAALSATTPESKP